MTLIIKKLDGYFEGHIEANELEGDFSPEDARESELYRKLILLPKWKMMKIQRAVSLARKDKFEYDRKSKYGNLPRSMDKEQLRLFFASIRNPSVKAEFLLQFFFALRVGEIKNVRIVPGQDLLRIENKKCDRVEYLPLYEPVRSWLLKQDRCRTAVHSKDYLRKCFRAVRNHTTLNYQYADSRTGSHLFQFSTHSLRHSSINIFGSYIKDPYKIAQFSRHCASSIMGVQSVYRSYPLKELQHDLSLAFADYGFLLDGL